MRPDRQTVIGVAQAAAPFALAGVGLSVAVIPPSLPARFVGTILALAGIIWLLGEAFEAGKAEAYREAVELDRGQH